MVECRKHRVGCHAAHRAQAAVHHGVTQVAQQMHLLLFVLGVRDAVDRFHTSCRADAARRALATTLDGTKLHGVTR